MGFGVLSLITELTKPLTPLRVCEDRLPKGDVGTAELRTVEIFGQVTVRHTKRRPLTWRAYYLQQKATPEKREKKHMVNTNKLLRPKCKSIDVEASIKVKAMELIYRISDTLFTFLP